MMKSIHRASRHHRPPYLLKAPHLSPLPPQRKNSQLWRPRNQRAHLSNIQPRHPVQTNLPRPFPEKRLCRRQHQIRDPLTLQVKRLEARVERFQGEGKFEEFGGCGSGGVVEGFDRF